MKKNIIFFLLISIVFSPQKIAFAEENEVRNIHYPTDKTLTFYNDFGNARYNHSHEGTDILGPKMTHLYSTVDGRVTFITDPEASYGYMITIKDSDDYTYHYIHINNDNPGTDDGNGGTEHAYAPGIKRGAQVEKGQLIGWMGDSGNAESVASQLHFEIRKPNKDPINPYFSLVTSLEPNIDDYNISIVMSLSDNINIDKNIPQSNASVCESGTRIKVEGSSAVYYCGADGKRYVFPTDKVYFSWYSDFEDIIELPLEDIYKIPLGGNVTYKPGIKMLKLTTDPRVYAIDTGGVLRWIKSEEAASLLYGSDWNQRIDDMPDAFYMDYKIGEPIGS